MAQAGNNRGATTPVVAPLPVRRAHVHKGMLGFWYVTVWMPDVRSIEAQYFETWDQALDWAIVMVRA